LVTEGQVIPVWLEAQCHGVGLVRQVVHAVMADDYGVPAHLGDLPTRDDALAVINRLRFETGHYSRCWEISTAHLPAEAWDYLQQDAARIPLDQLFEAFPLPASRAVG